VLPPLKKILYVEDEPDIVTIAELALATLGNFEFKSCSSGTEALATIPQFKPDLVLLDVMMPGMDGVATLGALRADPATAQIPIVFMTARSQPAEIARYRSLGALDVITKPFDPLVLADQVRAIWQRAHVEP
jgi:two-component system OmpR family response regulator